MYPFGVQSSAASNPSSFQTGPSALLLKNHNVGQGCAWSLSLEGTFDLFFPTLQQRDWREADKVVAKSYHNRYNQRCDRGRGEEGGIII